MKDNIEIKYQCVFCKSTNFDLNSNYGDSVKCANCGQLNSLAIMKNAAIRKGTDEVAKMAKEEMEKVFKSIKSKNIKIKF